MNTIFVSARSNSTRLPNKATEDLCGIPTIEFLLRGLKKSRLAKEIILCTTQLRDDDVLCDIAERNNLRYFRGSSEDKLIRWHGACEQYGVDFFVNVDGDDLFFDAPLADLCFQQRLDNSGVDFIDGRGLYNDVYGISHSSLAKVCEAKKTTDTEFIRPHFINFRDRFVVEKVQNVPEKYLKKDIRMTLDYWEDLLFFRAVIGGLQDMNFEINFDNILKFLEENPEVVKINWFREQAWKENQSIKISQVRTQ